MEIPEAPDRPSGPRNDQSAIRITPPSGSSLDTTPKQVGIPAPPGAEASPELWSATKVGSVVNQKSIKELSEITRNILDQSRVGTPLDQVDVARALKLATDIVGDLSRDLDYIRNDADETPGPPWFQKIEQEVASLRSEIANNQSEIEVKRSIDGSELDNFVGVVFRVLFCAAFVAVATALGPALLTVKSVWLGKVIDGAFGALAGAVGTEVAQVASTNVPEFVDKPITILPPPPPIGNHGRSIPGRSNIRRDGRMKKGQERSK